MSKVDPLQDWEGFYKEFENETPRGIVILAGAFLDAQLRNLISKFLIDEPKITEDLLGGEDIGERPLSSFGSRIKVAYSLGLISRSVYDDLIIIKKIRNKFAHRMHDYTFDEPQVIDWCKSLKLAKQLTDSNPRFPNSHGNMFLLSVTAVANWLALWAIKAERSRRTPQKDPALIRVEATPVKKSEA